MPRARSRCSHWMSAGRGGFPVDDEGAHAARMVEEAHRVGRAADRRHRVGVEEQAHQPPGAAIGHQDVPVAVDDQAGVGLLLAHHEVERAPHVGHLGRLEAGLPVHRRVAGGGQQVVAAARRDLEHAAQQQHHVAARLGAARLDEAQVPRGDLGVHRQGELAQAPALAPLLEQPAEVPGRAARGSPVFWWSWRRSCRKYTQARDRAPLPRR